jgi:hypothetical protein
MPSAHSHPFDGPVNARLLEPLDGAPETVPESEEGARVPFVAVATPLAAEVGDPLTLPAVADPLTLLPAAGDPLTFDAVDDAPDDEEEEDPDVFALFEVMRKAGSLVKEMASFPAVFTLPSTEETPVVVSW